MDEALGALVGAGVRAGDEGALVAGAEGLEPVALKSGPRGPYVRWSAALGAAICERISLGESLMEICREADMPGRATVKRWMRQRPNFARRMDWAVRAGRNAVKGGARSTYHRTVAALICRRIVMGEALTRICRDEGMPCLVTVYNWMRRHPEFAQAYEQARELQAHLKFDQIWDEAEAATPRTAYLAQVRITALRWQAARLAPKAYGVKPEAVVAAQVEAAAREEAQRAMAAAREAVARERAAREKAAQERAAQERAVREAVRERVAQERAARDQRVRDGAAGDGD